MQKSKKRGPSATATSKDRSDSKPKTKEISQGEKNLLAVLRKKQGPELKTPTDIRPNFKEPTNKGSSKGDDEKNKKESKDSKKVMVFSKKDANKPKTKIEIEFENSENEEKEEIKVKSSKSEGIKGKEATTKLKNKKGDAGKDTEVASEEESERTSEADTEKESDDDYLDVPDKQLKRNYSANEKVKFSKFAAQFELDKAPKRLKSAIREKYQQQPPKTSTKTTSEILKSKADERKKIRKEREPEKPVRMRRPSAQNDSLTGENVYRASDLYIELEDVEIESEVEDYHAYRNEHKPGELVVELAEGAQESSKKKKASVPREKKPSVPKEKIPKEKLPKVPRKGYYSLEEDLKLLEYVKEHPSLLVKPTSRKFWEDAIRKDNILEGTRSSDSLRERYRWFLAGLDEADNAEIERWVSIHGHEGFLLFKKRELDGNQDLNTHQHRLDTIVLKYHPSTQKAPVIKPKKEKKEKVIKEKRPPGRPRKQGPEGEYENSEKKNREERPTEEKRKPERDSSAKKSQQKKKAIVHEDVEDEKGNEDFRKKIEKYLEEVKQKQKMKESKQAEMMIEKEGGEEEIKEPKPEKKVRKEENEGDKKEKEFASEGKQYHKVNVQMNQRDMQKVAEKADWIKNLSAIYGKSPREFLQIYYNCSMNAKLLDDYLKGDDRVIWTKEEDEVLMQGRDRAVRVLGKHKSLENIQLRIEFLKNYQNLERSLDSEHYLLH